MSTTHAPATVPRAGLAPRSRSTAGYWLAAAVALVGLAAAFVWAAFGAVTTLTASDRFARGTMPGAVSVRVAHPGTAVVYYEGGEAPSLPSLRLQVVDFTGHRVPVRAYAGTLRYDSPVAPGTTATAVATFRAGLVGTYTVHSAYPAPPTARLAVGEDLGAGFLARLLPPTLLAAGAVLAGAAGIWATTVYRRRANA